MSKSRSGNRTKDRKPLMGVLLEPLATPLWFDLSDDADPALQEKNREYRDEVRRAEAYDLAVRLLALLEHYEIGWLDNPVMYQHLCIKLARVSGISTHWTESAE